MTSGILRKAGELGKSATLVIGKPGSGKSTTVRDTILTTMPDPQPLWVAFNNTSAIVPDPAVDSPETLVAKREASEWDIAIIDNWKAYDDGIATPAARGDFQKTHNVLVVDGLNVMAGMLLSHIAPGGQPSQPEWLQASNKLRDKFIAIREKFTQVYFIVDALPNKDGIQEIDLNRHAANLLTPLMGNRWYTYAVSAPKGNNLIYSVQKNPILAMAFQPNKE